MSVVPGGDPQSRYSQCRPFILEDDGHFRRLLTRAFKMAGVPEEHLRMVFDGEEAGEALQRISSGTSDPAEPFPSIIVLDVKVPKKTGLEVLALARGYRALASVPIFMLSASEHPDHIAKAYELGTDSYYVKPAELAELQTVVEGMLGFWHSRIHRRLPKTRPLDRPRT